MYRRFGHGDRAAMAEGYHEHSFSLENQEAAFAFLDRFNEQPAREGLAAEKALLPEELRCTPTGQVRVDLPGRSLMELVRDYYHENRATKALDLAALYRAGPPPTLTSWEAAGTERTGDVVRDRYRLRYGDGLVMPLVHVHRAGAGPQPVRLELSYDGTQGAAESPPDGWGVVTFDARALGENRMRYKAASIDDPELTKLDEEAAYVSPLSGVLANYAYNALLTGRPYFLELIEDAEIAGRFARERLGASRVAVSGRGPARTWAAAVVRAVPGIEAGPGVDPSALDWAGLVEGLQEAWPIHQLLPRGAYVR